MKRIKLAFVYLSCVLTVIFATFLLSSCTDHNVSAVSNKGFEIYGKVICNYVGIENVSIKVNNTHKTYSNQFGTFTLENLHSGDVITFEKDDFNFSPKNFTVTDNFYNLIITMDDTNSSIGSSDANTGLDDNTGNNPDKQPVDKTSLLPIQNANVINFNGNYYFSAYIDNNAQTFSFGLENQCASDIALNSSGSFDFLCANLDFFIEQAVLDNKTYKLLTINVTDVLTSPKKITFSISCSSKDYEKCAEECVNFSFSPTLEFLYFKSYNGVLTWQTNHCENVNYEIVVDNVLVATVSDSSFDLNALSLKDGDHSVYISAVGVGYTPNSSPVIHVTF